MQILRSLALAGALVLGAPAFAAPPVDINTADAEALAEAISGVGLKRAQAIIEYREKNGPFASVEELANVRGIGERIVEGSRENLTVGPKR